jgi:hypothetical protein
MELAVILLTIGTVLQLIAFFSPFFGKDKKSGADVGGGKWVQIRLFGRQYDNYCHSAGCLKAVIKEPIDFGFCEDHYSRYWKIVGPQEKTQPEPPYTIHQWMQK